MEQKDIARINELAHKAKSEGLTPEEAEEQARLRREYVAAFKRSLTSQLENTYVVTPDGKKRPLVNTDKTKS